MCGFSCYFHFDTTDGVYPNLDLDTSLQYIHHRGPDSRGKYVAPGGRCALGHVRLSIIDLAGGQQPLSNESGSVHAVVNGELYGFERIRAELQAQGHKFKTLSDSEIALHLFEDYDLGFLDHLRGEFAVCIWDSKKSRFIAARDRFGIKPMYYIISNGSLLVASEIKAFIPMGWKPEWDIDSVINNGPVTDNRTCFKGVYKLPPAHYLIATSSGSFEVRPYWDAEYPDKTVKETRTVDEMVQGVRDRLTEAVRHRLRADVPLGVYLSGGIDSSCIAGIASELLRKENPDAKLRAFSISFKDSDKYDESAIAERTAQFCNADFKKLSLTEDDLLGNFEESVWYVEQPQFNLNGVGKFLLSAFVRDQGYKEALFKRCDKNEEFTSYTDDSIGGKDLNNSDLNNRVRKIVNNINCHTLISKAISLEPSNYSDAALAQCGNPNSALAMAEAINGMARFKANTKWHPLHSALYIENHTFLPNYLCNLLGDRSEMAHSIEARTPFLDHHLCEYINHLPPSLKIKTEADGTLNEKWVLKEAVKPYITEEIYTRTKHAYIAPSSKGRNPMITCLISKLLTKENIDNLGWAHYEKFNEAKETYLQTGNEMLFRDMLIMMSYVVISQRFNVATCGVSETVAR